MLLLPVGIESSGNDIAGRVKLLVLPLLLLVLPLLPLVLVAVVYESGDIAMFAAAIADGDAAVI